MKLLVGLGNPGAQYAQTRHNAGFMVIERLSAEWGAPLRPDSRFEALVGQARLGSEAVILAEPTTFMNLSGQAVGKLMRFYKLSPAEVVVVYDELAIPLGALRIRPDGSAGGHNGVTSLIAHLGTQQFARVRVGVGPLPPGARMTDYVLGRFGTGERPLLTRAIEAAAEAAVCVLRHGAERAMQDYNGLKLT